ncbi:zinc-binding dehydrogenase [Pseudomonas arsenicoxydans]|uniref:Alcohol dehydrogenase n=1 Tax=Pseudomonas arsenicoxydans TaxID=702115 RepID=A0A502HXY6_9PSED|nr:zinc-binding dehydrogenase [Pseudomonas arsenicoxydans]TPG78222.1 alcohol dehydrogenase [Pseudomonas arsenicoxydans]
MRAVICRDQQLRVGDLDLPTPATGQMLVQVLRCGICGSDLHARQHCGHWGDLMRRSGYDGFVKPGQEVVFGHEICAEVVEHGLGCDKKIKPGTVVCAVPVLRNGTTIEMLGFSAQASGGYAEHMLLQESMMMPVPNGLSPDLAALTEPMAVALHAVNRGELKQRDVAIVIGCGPVGLAVICVLKARGIKTIIASDFSAGRRVLAAKCGADIVLDPAKDSPFANWKAMGHIGELSGALELAVGTREKLGKLPLPWWHTWRLAEAFGAKPPRPVIFECVGVPGLLQNVIDGAPMFSRVVVVGVCMQSDTLEPAIAINKEIDLRFVLGYTPLEFRDTLHMIADGKLNCAPLITGTVGLNGVEQAFTALGDPEQHAKILIAPATSIPLHNVNTPNDSNRITSGPMA